MACNQKSTNEVTQRVIVAFTRFWPANTPFPPRAPWFVSVSSRLAMVNGIRTGRLSPKVYVALGIVQAGGDDRQRSADWIGPAGAFGTGNGGSTPEQSCEDMYMSETRLEADCKSDCEAHGYGFASLMLASYDPCVVACSCFPIDNEGLAEDEASGGPGDWFTLWEIILGKVQDLDLEDPYVPYPAMLEMRFRQFAVA